jgi:hypothetical protein
LLSVTKNPDPVHMAYSPLRLRRFLPLLLSVLCLVWLVNGCSSRPAAAQRLFAQGDYQRVIEEYPDLEIARRAEAKLAEKLLEDKRYGDVIRQYPQTPAAYKAKQSLAQQLFDAGNYVAVIDSFSYLPLAAQARERIADSLFASGRFDDLIMRYPDTPQAKELKERRAQKRHQRLQRGRGSARQDSAANVQVAVPPCGRTTLSPLSI